MPTVPEVRKMTKAQLVDTGIELFEDDGNLRAELEATNMTDLKDLIINEGLPPESSVEPQKEETVPVTPKNRPNPLDLR